MQFHPCKCILLLPFVFTRSVCGADSEEVCGMVAICALVKGATKNLGELMCEVLCVGRIAMNAS